MNRLRAAFNSPAFLVPAMRLGRDTAPLRFILLGLGLVVYGLFGSPTPEDFSLALVVCAALFIAALPLGGHMPVLWPGRNMPLSHDAGLLFVYYGLSVPLIAGLLSGHEAYSVLRDMIWLGLMSLPVLYVYSLRPTQKDLMRLMALLAFAGWLLAARVVLAGWIAPLKLPGNNPVLYLPNSPLVLFAALWLGGTGLYRITCGARLRSLAAGCLLAGLALVPVAAMMSMLQRASFAVLGLGLFIFIATICVRAPGRLWRVGAVLTVAAVFLGPAVMQIYELLWDKTRHVGTNMRLAEAWTVLRHAAVNPFAVMFGHGWGAVYVSPAVGDVPVGYTHSLITYLFLKTGMVGLVLGGLYIGALLSTSLRWLGQWPVLAYSLCMPVVVHAMLYANHKSFGFAMLLVGCAQAGFSCRHGDDTRVKS